ncbi:tyrosine-protein phosphatase non-receptor type 61F isoform X1 [Lucilia sericata]|uniref:tyrosine-protein phosphatase non-receptor type 61F isoform X1 n=1 Tax=Lucilia sericata TaxID=13632 RepID=UPI0018A85920|nr:tyrosine-protein phosphatase non-receptor type 61F isoform X1 [Lucilia sericata]
MTSTSNSSSSSSASTTSSSSSSSSTSAGVSDTNYSSADISNNSTNRVVANMSGGGDGNSNDTPPLEASTPNNIELEYKKITGDRNGWQRLYQEIREKCEREANEKHFGTIESEKPQNRCLNRYRDVNPYDHSRIIIHRGGVDYINANLVKLERAERKYILTQGPLGDTVGHFWLMVWEQKTKAILMLNKLMEKKQVKCHLYWPERKGLENALKLNEVKLTIEFLRCEEYKNFCVRWFKLTDIESNQSREIIQFHYTTWPDFGIPSSPVAFLQFLKQVRDSGALEPDVGPAVVHCSAGIGRSGTFCLVDCCLVLVDKEGVQNVSVQDVLYELRRYRMGLIQTADQLYFSYQAIIEGIKLLKDPKFIDYNEAPIVTSDDSQHHEQYIIDETPPPLPPRTHSLLPLAGSGADGILRLNLAGSQGKPLPKIPASVSFNDDLYAPDNDNTNKDALNNFINNERSSESNTSMTNRPLPPLPTQQNNSLNRVHESDSDENEYFENDDSEEDDIDDNDDDDDDADDNNDHEEDKDNANYSKSRNKDKFNHQSHQQQQHSNATTNEQSVEYDSMNLNGIETANTSGSTSPELRRRKRAEHQANIEQKVNEIKRKQRENEENKQAAKKRRSLITYITAGVIVGVICVYAYSKWA